MHWNFEIKTFPLQYGTHSYKPWNIVSVSTLPQHQTDTVDYEVWRKGFLDHPRTILRWKVFQRVCSVKQFNKNAQWSIVLLIFLLQEAFWSSSAPTAMPRLTTLWPPSRSPSTRTSAGPSGPWRSMPRSFWRFWRSLGSPDEMTLLLEVTKLRGYLGLVPGQPSRALKKEDLDPEQPKLQLPELLYL